MAGWAAAALSAQGIFMIVLSVLRFRVRGKRGKWAVFMAHLAAVAAGAVCLILSGILAGNASGGTADQLAWAADAYALWMRAGGIFAAAVGGVLLIASLIRHKMVKVRALAGCAAVLVLLFFGGSYGVICIGETVNPAVWVWLGTAGYAGVLMTGGLADAGFDCWAARRG